jgi:peroxiredoxin
MTKIILFVGLLLMSLNSYTQNAKQILQRSYAKCLSVKSGYYEMEQEMKFMDSNDTTAYGRYKFYFRKTPDDSIYSLVFNSESYFKGIYFGNVLYTGDDYVTYSKTDSSAQIMSVNKWAKVLRERSHNDIFKFYLPFTSEDCEPLPHDSDYIDNNHVFKFVAKEVQNNMLSYHVQVIEYPKFDSSDVLHTIRWISDFWVNTEDMVPIKYSASIKVLDGSDTLNEYSSYTLKKYNLYNGKSKISMPLELSSIPAYCKIRDYLEAKKLPLLSSGISAPVWALTSINNKKISLKDYKGKVVLVDFFYRSCYPCLKALPVMQSLNEKYKNKGLAVIGIDPVDKANSDIGRFILHHGITYDVLLDQNEVAKQYNVSFYPTLYLIDKAGKIIYADSGFDEKLKDKLENLIKSNL